MTDNKFDIAVSDDLIYDVGLHMGEDTDFYLKKGFRVVAFEANPYLIERCKKRFKVELDEGRLTIIEGAIVDPKCEAAERGSVSFHVCSDHTIWGTVNDAWMERNKQLGHSSTRIEVPTVDFAQVIRQLGMPHYMKIDIEGCDQFCLATLDQFTNRPRYLSFESDKTSLALITSEIEFLTRLGYDAFQAVEQSSIPSRQRMPRHASEGRSVEHTFEAGSSGMFGRELPGAWHDAASLRRRYAAIRLGYYLVGDDGVIRRWRFPGSTLLRKLTQALLYPITGAPVPGWYDTHARLARTPPQLPCT